MRHLLCFLFLCAALPLYGRIKNISIYPSGISVPWKVLPPAVEEEIKKEEKTAEKKKKPPLWRRSKKQVEEVKAPEPPAPPPAPEMVSVNRLVRVVSAMDLAPGEQLALVFYDEKKNPLKKDYIIVTNTAKPSAAHVFFMDKLVYGRFQGLIDCYFFPPKAVYMNVAVLDKKGAVINVPSNPDYDQDKLLSIEEFQDLEKGKRMMLQFEIRGNAQTNVLRMAVFRFR